MQNLLDTITNFILLLPAWQQVIVGGIVIYFTSNFLYKTYRVTRAVTKGAVVTTKGLYSVVTWPVRSIVKSFVFPKTMSSLEDISTVYKAALYGSYRRIPSKTLESYISCLENMLLDDPYLKNVSPSTSDIAKAKLELKLRNSS